MASNQTWFLQGGSATVAAAGTIQSTATAIVNQLNLVTVGTVDFGVILPLAYGGDVGMSAPVPCVICNTAVVNLKVWPPVGGTIDGGSANAAIDVAAGSTCVLYAVDTNDYRSLVGSITATQSGYLSGITPGTVTASKAVVVDSNKDASAFRNVVVTNLDAGASATAGTVDVFPTTASKGKIQIAAADQTGNTTLTITNATMGQAVVLTIPDGGASTDTVTTAKANNAFSGTLTQTSANAAAFTSGRQGATTPTLTLDSATGSCVTGLKITAAAAAAKVALLATSSGTDEGITLDAKAAGQINVANTSTGLVTIGRGSVKQPITSRTKTAVAAQNSTPTAAQLLGGYISHASVTGAGTATLDTAANLDTAITGVTNGDSFTCLYTNTGNQTVTVTTNTGLTLVGTLAIPTLRVATLNFVRTGAAAWDVVVVLAS